MDRPWKAPLAQKLIRPSSWTFRISTPGTWLRHAVQRLHASSCAGVFFTVEQATMRNATIVDVSVPMNARRVVTGFTSSARPSGGGGIVETQRLGGLEVDDQLERDAAAPLGDPRAWRLQIFIDIRGDTPIELADLGAVG